MNPHTKGKKMALRILTQIVTGVNIITVATDR